MKSFKDFGISTTHQPFTGDKIEMFDVLNREIIVINHKIETSKYPEKGNGKRLTLHIKIDDRDRIIFTGSVILQDLIQKVAADNFPFTATIVKENKAYKFT
jgi:hypothetical protein